MPNRRRHTAQESDAGAEVTFSKVELFLSACLWAIIASAVYLYWTLPSGKSIVDAALGHKTGAPNVTIDEPDARTNTGEVNCWSEKLPNIVDNHIDATNPPEMDLYFPTITLYAQCPLKSYVNAALRSPFWAYAWRFVRTTNSKKVVVQHHGQNPVSVDIHDEGSLAKDILRSIMPRIGNLNGDMSKYFFSTRCNKLPLVTFMPEPALDTPAVYSKYRRLMMLAYEAYPNNFTIAYILTGVHHDWVASEFGVTSFPNIVVHKKFPGLPYVYNGDMSKESIVAFLGDVLAGCTDYRPHRAAAAFRKRDRLVCNAAPVLSSS